mgnify:CR=1 FL=1
MKFTKQNHFKWEKCTQSEIFLICIITIYFALNSESCKRRTVLNVNHTIRKLNIHSMRRQKEKVGWIQFKAEKTWLYMSRRASFLLNLKPKKRDRINGSVLSFSWTGTKSFSVRSFLVRWSIRQWQIAAKRAYRREITTTKYLGFFFQETQALRAFGEQNATWQLKLKLHFV